MSEFLTPNEQINWNKCKVWDFKNEMSGSSGHLWQLKTDN